MNASSTLGTSSPMLSTRPDFGSENDIRKCRIPLTTTNIARNTILHSNSSTTLRTSDHHHHQVTYNPQTNPIRSQSVHPTTTNTNNTYASTTSLSSTTSGGTTTMTTTAATGKGLGNRINSIPLTRKSITEYSNRTFRVIFSDESVMIIREDSPDGQIFIDAQGKRYSFDRRQAHQPEAIQERLALFYQNEHDVIDYTTS